MAEPSDKALRILKRRKVELLDMEYGVLRCKTCGKYWAMDKSKVAKVLENETVLWMYAVDWEFLRRGWWKCPNGCWDQK